MYKETYIRHLKSRGLSVTKLTKKRNGLFVTEIREFQWVFWRHVYENLGCFNTKKGGLWVTDDKITGLSVKNEVLR